MLTHITTLEDLEKESIEIDKFLNITCGDDMNELVNKGNDLVVYIARTGKMLADAKYWQDDSIKNSIVFELGKSMNIPPSILNKLVDSSCKHENYLVNWIDRLNRTATHQLDWVRTLISKGKEELKIQSYLNHK